MTLEKVIGIMVEHGLYCRAISDCRIALEDVSGNVYDTVTWDGKHIIEEDGQKFELMPWLGY